MNALLTWCFIYQTRNWKLSRLPSHSASPTSAVVKGSQQPVLCFKHDEISKSMWRVNSSKCSNSYPEFQLKHHRPIFGILLWLASPRLADVSCKLIFDVCMHLEGRRPKSRLVPSRLCLRCRPLKMRLKNFPIQLLRWIFKALNH